MRGRLVRVGFDLRGFSPNCASSRATGCARAACGLIRDHRLLTAHFSSQRYYCLGSVLEE